ncbi:uncharacterized protein LOC130735972 [Lotus japonicus]|uniref:uncharacterized protein LOC130735972 n=1 Tax=Lotus japonicus TaxID=34305 RepID=UPI002586D221|nr:uncharacterized protein LOC130735972 [Lotus japonicus]
MERNFDLSNSEIQSSITVEDDDCRGDELTSLLLAGKLWTESSYNVRAFTQTVTTAWKLRNPVEIREISKNRYVFRFATERDLRSVIDGGPWSFNRMILVLKRFSDEVQPSEIDLSTVDMWIRVYDLPLKLKSESIARRLGNSIGFFVAMDARLENQVGLFLRLRVTVDLTKALMRGTVLVWQGKELRVLFRYERLPVFCFVCGKIGHQMKDCEVSEVVDEDSDSSYLPYGPWLRVQPFSDDFSVGRVLKSGSQGASEKVVDDGLVRGKSVLKPGSQGASEIRALVVKDSSLGSASQQGVKLFEQKSRVDSARVPEKAPIAATQVLHKEVKRVLSPRKPLVESNRLDEHVVDPADDLPRFGNQSVVSLEAGGGSRTHQVEEVLEALGNVAIQGLAEGDNKENHVPVAALSFNPGCSDSGGSRPSSKLKRKGWKRLHSNKTRVASTALPTVDRKRNLVDVDIIEVDDENCRGPLAKRVYTEVCMTDSDSEALLGDQHRLQP